MTSADRSPVSRRTVLGLTVAGVFGIGALIGRNRVIGRATASVDLIAEDQHLENDGGELRNLSIQPEVTVSWVNFTSQPTTVELYLDAVRFDFDVTGSWDVESDNLDIVLAETDAPESTNEITPLVEDPLDIVYETSATHSDFEPAYADSKTSAVEVDLGAVVSNDEEEAIATCTGAFEVTVTDTAAYVDTEGSLGVEAT